MTSLWYKETSEIKQSLSNRKRILTMDNINGQNETPELLSALSSIKTEIRQLPANATDLLQQADFLIQNSKPRG